MRAAGRQEVKSPLPIDLIIFDCDGVLVDSEVVSCRVHAQMLNSIGYTITADQVFDRFLGRSSTEAHREIEAELGRALPDGFDARLKEAVIDELTACVEPVPHIAAALDAIKCKICVASSGIPAKINATLTRTKLIDRFAPHLFSATQVVRGKPAPDLFLFAAQQMGVAPKRCIVIEDSLPGIISAEAAGMAVIGFRGGAHFREHPKTAPSANAMLQSGATWIIDDMQQLAVTIEKISTTRAA